MNLQNIHIHFVCNDNARSRMAKTYLVSKNLPNLIDSSSVLVADENRTRSGPICWYALKTLTKHKLIQHLLKPESLQTQKEHLLNVYLVIFMRGSNYQKAKEKFNFHGKYEVWDIPNIYETGILDQFSDEN